MNKSKNWRFSLSASSSSSAVSQLPLAARASLCAASVSIPRRSTRARSIDASSMRLTSMRWARLRIVSISFSGSSHTMTNTVSAGGSSSSLSILLAHSAFIRSGSHIITTLYPPWLDFRQSLRMSKSLSPTPIRACWLAAFISASHWSIVK